MFNHIVRLATDTGNTLTAGEIAGFIFAIASIVVGVFLAGAASTMIATRQILKGIQDSIPVKDFIEKLYMSAPADTRDLIRRAVKVAEDVTDGQPNVPDGDPVDTTTTTATTTTTGAAGNTGTETVVSHDPETKG